MSGNHSALSDFEGRVCSGGSLHLSVQKRLYYTAQGKLLATKNISREYLKKLIQDLPQWFIDFSFLKVVKTDMIFEGNR